MTESDAKLSEIAKYGEEKGDIPEGCPEKGFR